MFALYVIFKALGYLLAAVFVVAALFFYGLFLMARSVFIFFARELAVQRAAKSDRG